MAIDSYTKVLLHFDGSDASTTFTDVSGKTWTAHGSAQLDTADSKFSGSSGLSSGSGDYIETPDHTDFVFGSGDFTIDGWFKLSSAWGVNILSRGTQFVFYVYYDYPNLNLTFRCYDGSVTEHVLTHSTVVTTGAWHHAAVVMSSNYCTLYLDGIGSSSEYISSVYNFAGTVKLLSGGNSGVSYWMDELRVSKGIARWTSDFNVPTMPYGMDDALQLIMMGE